MATYTKQPISVADQMATLKSRGLLFDDEQSAIAYLKIISYFRLANYWKPLECDKVNHVFKPNSKFENVVILYNFDKELRNLIFSAIQSIEIALRTKIIQIVSPNHGAFWFADKSLFSNTAIFSKCLANIKEELKRSKEDFLVEHFEKYDNPPYPPAWKTLEVSSFGTLAKLYCNLSDNKLKKQIARELGLPQHLYLESWIKSLAVLRNCIAHHARIWNRKYPWKPQLPKKLQNPWIQDKTIPHEKLYAQLCCLVYLTDAIHPDSDVKQKLKTLLAEYPIVDVAAMGFPKTWYNEPLWN
ncbi:MAG: Abi family protein [Mangrovibacterium sp.]